MIIGVCGFISSGKDTVADYLVNFHEFRRESFANSLKDAISAVFGWDRTLVEGRTKAAREWREEVDVWWATRLEIPHLTPRWVMQQWGTDVLRTAFHDDIWIASLERKLITSNDDIVISDCRFPNEFKAIHNAGGKIIKVTRGDDPEWITTAKIANQQTDFRWANYKTIMETSGIHASEWGWVGLKVDAVVDNNGTIDDLYNSIKKLVITSSMAM